MSADDSAYPPPPDLGLEPGAADARDEDDGPGHGGREGEAEALGRRAKRAVGDAGAEEAKRRRREYTRTGQACDRCKV